MDLLNPKQTVLFPDLIADIDLPSITTLPEYERAIKNFIKISDFGAFIELNVSGIEKSFSLSLNELRVPQRYRLSHDNIISPAFHLFPAPVRNHLNRLKYDARAFFNRTNSIKTIFGYFLLRQYFHLWDQHRKDYKNSVVNYLQNEIGEKRYRQFFVNIWNEAVHFLQSGIKRKFHHMIPMADIDLIRAERERLERTKMSVSQLDHEDPDYFFKCLAIKTLHIPIDLKDYIQGILIYSTFTTVHLEHLKKTKIETREDLLEFLTTIQQKS